VYRYTIVLLPDPDGEGYTVRVPELPGCITEGETVEEALLMAKDAIFGHIETLALTGRAVPVERPPLLVTTVEVEEPCLDLDRGSEQLVSGPGSE